ncbi:MAG: NB-ARC domain-containing protein, partial [Myxococcota bacterium]|nr:NB-ARC domain-containing protein [Myxococcota bacterium]
MAGDIYGSMAEGVSNASCVVCFMSQKYQESSNCRLELQFAKQSGVSILPVMVEGSGWRASGWLGLLTAGSLWTRLKDDSSFEENVRQLQSQIHQMIGDQLQDDDEEESLDDIEVSPSEAKEELDRLRDDLVSKTETASVAVLADPSEPATLPAGVPKLPTMFQDTEQITELTRLVLSTTASDMRMSRVGFWGMGGIGKTVTGAAIVRNEEVRLHFHAVIWLPLGQTPVISKLQNLCHMQCTGKELSSELSLEEKKEALQQAMAGKRLLLCLDDLWEEQHELELNFAYVSAGSKVLISTRMKALLRGGHQVEVGLPSTSDSARMLLSAADAEVTMEPQGVREIVDLCGRLPLALGIAGRLAASLGLVGTDDWRDMIGVLKEELRESHSGGREEGMIRASLRGLKGSAKEQANVKRVLLLFAL